MRLIRYFPAALAPLLLSLAVSAAVIEGHVVGVRDGDTVTVLDASRVQHRIRLAGIDAPELGQAFGRASKLGLSDQVYDRQVVVDWTKKDKYGRIVGKVLVDGRDANLQQLQQGLAWHYKAYSSEQTARDRLAYAQMEDDARSAQRGLWRDPRPVPPWDYRRAGRERGHGVTAQR